MSTQEPTPDDKHVYNGRFSPLGSLTHDSSHSPPISSVQIPTTPLNPQTTQLLGVDASKKNPEKEPSVESVAQLDYRHIYWATPCGLVAFLLLGVVSAVAHHLFYDSLDKRSLDSFSQEWAVRIGTGLAFFTKACLVASAAIAYQQHYWTLLRTQALPVKSIDKVMALLSDPTCFGDLDVLRRAWSCIVIALVIWCIPLSAIVPPASLTAKVSLSTQTRIEDVPIVRWDQVYVQVPSGRGTFEDASQESYRIVSAVTYGGTILPMLPSHQNYSYAHSFPGPRLRCKNVEDKDAFSEHVKTYKWSHQKTYYNATMSLGDMTLWISTYSRNFTCQTWNVTYTTTFSFTNGVQDIRVNEVNYDHVVVKGPDAFEGGTVNRNYSPYNDGYLGWITALASILTGSIEDIMTVDMLDVTTKILQSSLAGCPELENARVKAQTFNAHCPKQDLVQAIESLSENVTLSYLASIPNVYKNFSATRFRYDANTGQNIADPKPNMTYTSADVTVSSTEILFSYNARILLLSYFLAVFVTFVILLIGLRALWINRVSHSSSFSSILCTTRNAELDTLVQGSNLGAQPLEKALAKQKLQFGVLRTQNGSPVGVGHTAFGPEDSIVRLRYKKPWV